ncbi:MAG: hypothetical protein NVV60_14300 [Luteimonas sp.]|nr:hypothetical protein [Luteimonas sp.]
MTPWKSDNPDDPGAPCDRLIDPGSGDDVRPLTGASWISTAKSFQPAASGWIDADFE